MTTFNGSPTVQAQRLEFYDKQDAYVEVVLRAPQKAMRVAEGGEIHYDDGSIAALEPGDWVIEGFDGRLRRIPRAVFDASYVQADDGAVHADIRRAKRDAPPSDAALARPNVEPAETGTVRDEQLPAEPSRLAEEMMRNDAPVVAAPELSLAEAAHRKIAAGDARNLTPAEKEALRQAAISQATESAARVAKLVQRAHDEDIITTDEANAWLQSGTIPDGLTVEAKDYGYQLTRAGVPLDVILSEAEVEPEGAAPEPAPEQALQDELAADARAAVADALVLAEPVDGEPADEAGAAPDEYVRKYKRLGSDEVSTEPPDAQGTTPPLGG